jgi:uncharacterized membrane protein YedE/YeeE
MTAPFYKYGLFGDSMSLVIAFLIGIGFGFFLERAGFGNARVLAAQFYFTNLRVFKVMFTAILTAMLGIFYLSWIGPLDLSLVYVSDTYLLPQIVGGLILGVGFVIGGYCPGTSAVSASTGRIDGAVYLLGMVTGLVVFAEFFPLVESFYNATPMGRITLPELFQVPYGLLVFLIVIMAVGAFAGGSWVEKKMAARKGNTHT